MLMYLEQHNINSHVNDVPGSCHGDRFNSSQVEVASIDDGLGLRVVCKSP